MPWTDIASIVFVCVTVNHLGLISAIEDTIGKKLPILNCPKCLTCWCVMLYCLCNSDGHITQTLAISFLCSYLAIWLEMLEAYTDTLYMICYDKITKGNTERETATSAQGGTDAGPLPNVRKKGKGKSKNRKIKNERI